MKLADKIIGTLVPINALSSLKLQKEDNGTFDTANIFLDWLKKTHQNAWQFLPIHETPLLTGSRINHINSPYKSYGIGIDPKYTSSIFKQKNPTKKEKEDFIQKNRDWINDYVLFCSLRDYFETDDWRKWNVDISKREKKALVFWESKLAKDIDNYVIQQWRVHESFKTLKEKATKLNIMFIGDLSFYIDLKGPLVWANQEAFQLTENGEMKYVSGVPDRPNEHFGRQVWGHPLYSWGSKTNNGAALSIWKIRIKYASTLFDYLRFDHIVGFLEYGAMDPRAGVGDKYMAGPGEKVLTYLVEYGQKNGLSIFAEDSGRKLYTLRKILQNHRMSGIKIFRYALDGKKNKIDSAYAKINEYGANSIVYTTTHDTDTLIGYLQSLTTAQKIKLSKKSGVPYSQDIKLFAINIRHKLINSKARVCIFPIQDLLLTTDRINIPGTERDRNDQNWKYKVNTPIENLPVKF